MATFESGVSGYIHGHCTVTVHFPVDFKGSADVRFDQCRYYSRNGTTCKLNGAVVEYPEKYIGSNCPLDFD